MAQDLQSTEAKNKCPNCPLSVANSFIKACMNGEINNALKYTFKSGDKLTEPEDIRNVLTGKLGLSEFVGQAKTNPTGASIELKEMFKVTELTDSPMVLYDLKIDNVAYVIHFMKANGKCCSNLKLEKINGLWKVVSMG